jgi:hypothetical protein
VVGGEVVELVEVLQGEVQLQSLSADLLLVSLQLVVVSADNVQQLQQLRGLLLVSVVGLQLSLVQLLPLSLYLLLLAEDDVLHLMHASRQAVFLVLNPLIALGLSSPHAIDGRELLLSEHVQSLLTLDAEDLLDLVQLLPLPEQHLVRIEVLLIDVSGVV